MEEEAEQKKPQSKIDHPNTYGTPVTHNRNFAIWIEFLQKILISFWDKGVNKNTAGMYTTTTKNTTYTVSNKITYQCK